MSDKIEYAMAVVPQSVYNNLIAQNKRYKDALIQADKIIEFFIQEGIEPNESTGLNIYEIDEQVKTALKGER